MGDPDAISHPTKTKSWPSKILIKRAETGGTSDGNLMRTGTGGIGVTGLCAFKMLDPYAYGVSYNKCLLYAHPAPEVRSALRSAVLLSLSLSLYETAAHGASAVPQRHWLSKKPAASTPPLPPRASSVGPCATTRSGHMLV
jgi:hypothetical protein